MLLWPGYLQSYGPAGCWPIRHGFRWHIVTRARRGTTTGGCTRTGGGIGGKAAATTIATTTTTTTTTTLVWPREKSRENSGQGRWRSRLRLRWQWGPEIAKGLQHFCFLLAAHGIVNGHTGVRLCHVVWHGVGAMPFLAIKHLVANRQVGARVHRCWGQPGKRRHVDHVFCAGVRSVVAHPIANNHSLAWHPWHTQ